MRATGRSDSSRNFWLGIYNGVFVTGGETFFHSALVLAPFLAALGAPAWAIGTIPALRVGGWFLPQLFVATRMAHVPFKLPLYRVTSTVRVIALALLTAAVFVAGDRPGVLVPLTMAMILVNSVAGGIGGVPFADVTAKVVPHHRLGTFWVLRNAIGGVLALLAGWFLRRLLDSGLPFPTDFGWIFLAGTLLMGSAYAAFALVREPSGAIATRERLGAVLLRLPSVLRQDASFRRYLRVRFFGLAALLAEPFYALYALEHLEAPASVLGLYIMFASGASILVSFAFRVPADRGRNVSVMQVSLGLLLLAPLIALVAGDWRLFGLVFAASAAGNAGMGIAAWNLLYAIAPQTQRPLYVGVANSLLTLPSLAPIAAGLVVGWLGFKVTFVAAALLAVAALAFAFRFSELRRLDREALEGRVH